MPRCDSDTMFYRICCALLIGTIFTFTVILTNVFVDIDGVITGNGRVKHHVSDDIDKVADSIQSDRSKPDLVDNSEVIYNDMKNLEDDADEPAVYRLKRSLDSTNIKFRIKIPKIKQRIVTDHLATLLDELEAEESDLDSINIENVENQPDKQNEIDRKYIKGVKDIDNGKSQNELIHLAMHNILLQGLIGHMDLNEVYKNVHALVDKTDKGKKNEGHRYNMESKLLEELIKCADLQKEIAEKNSKNNAIEKGDPKKPFKTVIDKNKENDINSKEDLVAVIKLIYNGKSIRVKEAEDQQTDVADNKGDTRKVNEALELLKDKYKHLPQQFLNGDAVIEYLNKHLNSLQPKYKNKRLKRNVHKSQGSSATKIRVKENKMSDKNSEEELYVEIEAHFDSKSMKGEKKRKLVKEIIDQIREAIHDDIKNVHKVKKKPKHFLIKKRFQNPLITKLQVASKPLPREQPPTAISLRETDSLGKIYSANTEAMLVDGRAGNTWKKSYYGPQFLSPTKGINAAEMGEINIRYDIDSNGISQRLQQPLNANIDDENATSFYKLGNLKFYIKEIDGTGFAIGFNQYLGEPPDEESINTFTGIDNLIKAYTNPEYTDAVNTDPNESQDSEENSELYKRETRNMRKHSIVRRSVEENNDYHSNEYKIIFNKSFLPYDSYQEVFEDRSKKVQISVNKDTNHDSELIKKNTDDTVAKDMTNKSNLEKELRPSEIFRLANLLGRRKRSIKVQKYTNLKMRSKLNRYINTDAKRRGFKRILYKKKPSRNKRQIENIRITAADKPNEKIFLIADGDTRTLADRAMVREVELPGNSDQVNEVIQDNYRYIMPYAYNEPNHASYVANVFGGRSRHNSLMSKYPHIFMEEISRSKEDGVPENSFRVNNSEEPQEFSDIYSTTETISAMLDVPGLRLKEIDGSISPNTNYKLTVKILPKNTSEHGMHSGFKEIHTSINKSISKNGILFSSLFNMSEISKIEEIHNKTNEKGRVTISPLESTMKTQQEVLLRQQKKKIDAQINNLNKEKANINLSQKQQITKTDDVIDVVLPSNPPHILHLTKDEAGQLITSALMKLKDTPHTNDLHATLPTVKTTNGVTVPTPTVAITTTTRTSVDLDKQRILNSIQNNENLTHKILSKIDKTTEMLHKFFEQLGVNLEPLPDKKNDKILCRKPEQTIERRYQKLPLTYWRDHIQEPFFRQVMPNLEVEKNTTQVSIPFVYAYQQPYPLPTNNNKANIASVIYQGHIHTNAVRKSPEEHKLNSSNQTKFFIDSLEDAVKVSQGKGGVYPVKVATAGNITKV